ncbi:uncharacterized protein [Macaca nemestrina]|uniref:uncharacterized protein n=1 Tax=Macaca nemestrina TaxID=9545 RepID=UPI0039B98475
MIRQFHFWVHTPKICKETPVLRVLPSSGGSSPQGGAPAPATRLAPSESLVRRSPSLRPLACLSSPLPQSHQHGAKARGAPPGRKHLKSGFSAASGSTGRATFSLCAHLGATSPAEVGANGAVPLQRPLLPPHHGANSVQPKRINACGRGRFRRRFQPTDPPCTSLMPFTGISPRRTSSITSSSLKKDRPCVLLGRFSWSERFLKECDEKIREEHEELEHKTGRTG